MPASLPPATLILRPAAVQRWLTALWITVLGFTVVAAFVEGPVAAPLARGFNLAAERSVPRVFQWLLLLALFGLAAVVLWQRTVRGQGAGRLAVLTALCLALAVEQITAFHLLFQRWLEPELGAYTRFAASLPLALAVVMAGWVGGPALPRPVRAAVAWAITLYLCGAVGVYALSGFAVRPGHEAALLIAGQALETAAVSGLLLSLLGHAARTEVGYVFALAGPGNLGALRPAAALRQLAGLVGALVVLSLPVNLGAEARGGPLPFSLVQRFNLDSESSLATVCSGVLLLLAALLLSGITALHRRARDRWWPLWALLALVFLYLALDEMIALHEQASAYLPALVPLPGHYGFRWVQVAAPLVLVFALLYLRFLLHLPAPVRWLVALAGGVYVGGALGVELLGAAALDHGGPASLAYVAAQTLEETLEMVGVTLLIYALLRYVADRWGSVRIVGRLPEPRRV